MNTGAPASGRLRADLMQTANANRSRAFAPSQRADAIWQARAVTGFVFYA